MSLAWGGFTNGSAALEAVCVQAVGGIPGDLLEPATAAAWAGWRAAIAARTGVWLELDHSDAISPGLREVDGSGGQQAAWDRYQIQGRPIAAFPGTSNHGWGRAFDVTGYENRPDVWQAMNDLAPQFGLSNATGKASGERWHWESLNTPTTTASVGGVIDIPTGDEVDMASREDIKADTQAVVGALIAPLLDDEARELDATRREGRLWRLFKNTDKPGAADEYVAIAFALPPSDPRQVIYLNERDATAIGSSYLMTADVPGNARPLNSTDIATVVRMAKGTDRIFAASSAAS